MNRRNLLRSAATIGGGLGAIGASGRASADSMQAINPSTGEPIAYTYKEEAQEQAIRSGLGRDDIRQLKDGSYAVLADLKDSFGQYSEHRDHPNLRGYKYLGTLSAGDLCYWTGMGCTTFGFAMLFSPDPVTKGPAVFCGASGLGCGLHEFANRNMGCDWSYLHLYRTKWWNVRAHLSGMPFIAVPEVNC